jgi:hypothetical protein
MSYYICTSQYSHPGITSRQHTNGQGNLFVRNFGEKDWYLVDRSRFRNAQSIRIAIRDMGIHRFFEECCTLAEKPE